MKKPTIWIVSSIAIITIGLVIMGFMFDVSENEKQNGLTGIYDVTIDGIIAFVEFERGKPSLYQSDKDGKKELLAQFPVDQTIVDVSFSNDGQILSYAVTDKEMDMDSNTEIHFIHMDTMQDEVAFTENAIVTEIAFDPKDSSLLFYLRADTFTNYSPITGERPHDFDVYSFKVDMKKSERHTHMKKYAMSSLHVSSDDDTVFVQMTDDDDVQSADDVFQAKQRIFQIPLSDPEEKEIISDPSGHEDIYDFLIIPERNEIIFQAVSGTKSNGIFQYDLFSFNYETFETEQLTTMRSNASKPLRGPDDQIYFIVDRRFGERQPVYHLYKMKIDGGETMEVPLNH